MPHARSLATAGAPPATPTPPGRVPLLDGVPWRAFAFTAPAVDLNDSLAGLVASPPRHQKKMKPMVGAAMLNSNAATAPRRRHPEVAWMEKEHRRDGAARPAGGKKAGGRLGGRHGAMEFATLVRGTIILLGQDR